MTNNKNIVLASFSCTNKKFFFNVKTHTPSQTQWGKGQGFLCFLTRAIAYLCVVNLTEVSRPLVTRLPLRRQL